eukprot:55707-Pyramimonas_sp.AAC.1
MGHAAVVTRIDHAAVVTRGGSRELRPNGAKRERGRAPGVCDKASAVAEVRGRAVTGRGATSTCYE